MTLEEKKKKLAELNKSFAKKYGENGTVKTANNLDTVKFYSTGVMGIDLALTGGWGIGRVVAINGTYSSAKSSLAYMTIAEQQRKDPDFYAYIYDAEQSTDVKYLTALGVDLDRTVIDQTKSAEEGLTKLRDSIASGIYGIAVLDSTSALSPSKANDDDITATSMALVARILGNAYKQLAGVCADNNCTLIVIEQIRSAINTMGMGPSEVKSVGRSGEFTFSQQVTMRRQTKVTEEDGMAVSNEITFKVTKNKVGVPYRKCTLVCRYGEGIDKMTDLARASVQLGTVVKGGSWYYYPNKESCAERWQGEDTFCDYLKNNQEFRDKLYDETMNVYKNSDSEKVMQDDDKTDEIEAKKAELEDLKITSKDNDFVPQDAE